MQIRELIAFGGLVLMPMGIVIFADCFVLPAMGLGDEYCERQLASGKVATNWPAVVAWATSVTVSLPLVLSHTLEVFYAPLLGIQLAAIVYVGGSCVRDRALAAHQHSSANCKGAGSEMAP